MSSLTVLLFVYSFIGAAIILVILAFLLSRKIKKETISYDGDQIKSPEEYDREHPSTRDREDKSGDNAVGKQRDIQNDSPAKPSSDNADSKGKQSKTSETDKQPVSSVPDPEQVD